MSLRAAPFRGICCPLGRHQNEHLLLYVLISAIAITTEAHKAEAAPRVLEVSISVNKHILTHLFLS
jgi:hypothetical protein